MKRGQQFTVDQATYEMVGEPIAVAALTVVARVRQIDGSNLG